MNPVLGIQTELFFEEKLGGGGTKIPVGIHTGVKFEGIEKDQKWFDIKYSNADGRTIHKRLFCEANPKDGETLETAITRRNTNNIRHVVKLLRIFLGDEVAITVTAPDHDAYILYAAALLAPFKGQLVNLKVTLDRDGKYPELGYSSDYVERHIPGVATTLKFTNSEQAKIDAGPVSKEAPKPANDLPF